MAKAAKSTSRRIQEPDTDVDPPEAEDRNVREDDDPDEPDADDSDPAVIEPDPLVEHKKTHPPKEAVAHAEPPKPAHPSGKFPGVTGKAGAMRFRRIPRRRG